MAPPASGYLVVDRAVDTVSQVQAWGPDTHPEPGPAPCHLGGPAWVFSLC